MKLRWRLTKPWHYILYYLWWFLMTLISIFIFLWLLNYDHQIREEVKFSQLGVCTKDGESVRKTISSDGSTLYVVSEDIDRIYICGSVTTPLPIQLTINLDLIQAGDKKNIYNKTSSKPLRTGPFIFDLISTKRLSFGEYRATLGIGRVDHEKVRFLFEK